MGLNAVKVQQAIDRIKCFEPECEPYYLCYSGGKDSDAVRILATLAGVKFDLVYNHTTVDAPETVYYVKSIPGVRISYSYYKDGTPKTMWNLIPKKKLPPTRRVRYCCQEFKENHGFGRVRLTGVRSAESKNRALNSGIVNVTGKPVKMQKRISDMLDSSQYSINEKGGLILNFDNADSRRFVESCYRTTHVLVNPILDWSDSDVWDLLNHYGVSGNPLYQCGFSRIGCVGCPLGGSRSQLFEFDRYPKIKANYIRSFDRMLKFNSGHYKNWDSGFDVYQWWLGITPGQMSFFDFEEVHNI